MTKKEKSIKIKDKHVVFKDDALIQYYENSVGRDVKSMFC